MKHFILLFSLIFLAPFMTYFGGVRLAAVSSQDLAPVSLVTLTGGVGGPVARLSVQDQSGTADNPAKYVTFTTPGTIYKGYSRFTLPANIAVSSVTAMKVKINYKGLLKTSQRWLWSLYDWSAKKWVVVGDNASVKSTRWTAMIFSTTLPKRFISASREIRLLLQSNNASGNAKLDFESIGITYNVSATPTVSPTPTLSRTPTVFITPTVTRTPTATLPPGVSSAVYSDALVNGWDDNWSWGDVTHIASTNPVHGGANAIAVTYGDSDGGWDGLQFGLNDPFDISAYDTLRFWVHGGVSGGQTIQVSISDGVTPPLTQNITPQAGTWIMVDVPLAGLSQATQIAWQNFSSGAQPTFYIDDVAFIGSGGPTLTSTITRTPTITPPPGSGPALSVDVGADRHDISPYIYGMNFAAQALADELDLPVNRWGGNSTSRYNWQTGNTNAGSDWFYENKSDGNHTDWIDQNVATGSASIITVPMMGYVAKDGSTLTCGFKVPKYGAQQKTDSYSTDCGNGILASNGHNITGNDPLDTSIPFDENDVKSWVQSLVSTYGLAANGGVRFYDLDNEPELWSETHRDIHPTPESYDEIYNKGVTYATAIKEADPGAKTLGFVGFGWSGYWYSMRDMVAGEANGYTYFPDYATHGNLPQVPWYLSQMQQYANDHGGTRLLDYLDLHYYPENGVALSTAGDADKQALRLRSTRSLWDPTYIDESWIGSVDQAERSVHIIPRMRDWVNTYYPGTKLAMTEYNFGGLESINGALAQADILGIFGREGLDLATLWDPPTASQPGAYAFRIYRNYDGSHSFGNISVHAASTDQEQLAVYAAQRSSSDSALTLVVINKTGGALTSNLSLAGFTPSDNALVYRYSNANLNAIQHMADQVVSPSGFSATYPDNSITLLVIPGSAP